MQLQLKRHPQSPLLYPNPLHRWEALNVFNAAVTEYNVRFTSFVTVPNDGVGAEIVFNGRVKSVDEDTKSVTIALTATTNGKKIFGRAIATATLA